MTLRVKEVEHQGVTYSVRELGALERSRIYRGVDFKDEVQVLEAVCKSLCASVSVDGKPAFASPEAVSQGDMEALVKVMEEVNRPNA